MERFYTLAEATAMLPALTSLLEEMRAQGMLAALHAQSAQTDDKIKSNGHHNPAEDSMAQSMTQRAEQTLRDGLAQLDEWGIQLKDLSTGLIDFPALRQGRTVLLCWQLGEPEVAFWHETTTGFAGRQPIDDLIE